MDAVREYYDREAEREWNRLSNPYSRVEFESTNYLIKKYFPSEGKILDIGSGPGRYSLELLKNGYEVSLLDISINELNIAKDKIAEVGLKAEEYYCKSATDLGDFQNSCFDGILLMGPLYHIHHENLRLKVLKDVYRMLKVGGTALISYINSWGCLRAAVEEFPEVFEDENHFSRYLKGDLKFSAEESFTETYFTTPEYALEEVKKAGFNIISYAAAEGFLSGLRTQIANLAMENPKAYENFLKASSQNCELPQYRDSSEHLHIIVKK